jgi:hypothetical protein
MNALTRRGLQLQERRTSLAAFHRGMAFSWLAMAGMDRRIAALVGRTADPKSLETRCHALASTRTNLARVRERDAWARAHGHRLP